MTEYLPDTNHISPLVTPGHPLRERILHQIESGVVFAIATPALHEFLYGIRLIPLAAQNLDLWTQLAGLFKYYNIDPITAEQSAQLRYALRKSGRQLEAIDSFIAVLALRYNLVLLTTDKDFHHIPTLHYENWR